LQPIFSRAGLDGVEVFEVDFASLFSGKKTDVATKDPLIQRALRELLQFKEKKEKAGSALAISLDHISTPESLGELLDELLESAGPGVAAPSMGPTQPSGKIRGPTGAPARLAGGKHVGSSRGTKEVGSPGPLRGVRRGGELHSDALAGVSAEELAELASQAFLGTYEKLVGQAAPEERLAETAKVLASALVRLSPEARFALLRQLARDPKGNGAGSKGLTSLSSQVKDDLIVGSIASVLADQQGDPETISAIANLMRHLRPIESERRKLLDTLDETLRGEGHAIDGTVWQELQAHALGSNGLGMLEIPFRQKMKPLAAQAQAYRQQGSHDPEVKQVISTLEPRHRLNRSAKLLLELIPNNRELNQAEALMLKDTIEALEPADGAPTEDHLRLLAFLLKRGEGQRPSSAVMQVVKELLGGIKGTPRAVSLLKSGFCNGSALLADALLQALDGPLTIDGKRELVAAFAAMDEGMMRSLRPKVVDSKPFGVFQMILIALRANSNSGLELARLALRNRSLKSKESALRALGTVSEPGTIAFLAKGAGAEGDEESVKVLFLEEKQATEAEANLRQLQRAAIEALGQTRAEQSVLPLENLLMRRKLVGNTAFDSLRPYIAQALAANGTARARQVLTDGKVSKHQTIRDACIKAG
jgi:hypothetical protein